MEQRACCIHKKWEQNGNYMLQVMNLLTAGMSRSFIFFPSGNAKLTKAHYKSVHTGYLENRFRPASNWINSKWFPVKSMGLCKNVPGQNSSGLSHHDWPLPVAHAFIKTCHKSLVSQLQCHALTLTSWVDSQRTRREASVFIRKPSLVMAGSQKMHFILTYAWFAFSYFSHRILKFIKLNLHIGFGYLN